MYELAEAACATEGCTLPTGSPLPCGRSDKHIRPSQLAQKLLQFVKLFFQENLNTGGYFLYFVPIKIISLICKIQMLVISKNAMTTVQVVKTAF